MKHCIVCGEPTEYPVRSAFSHFHLYAPGNWKYFRGNMRQFGAWEGFWSTVGLICPAFNTLWHWRYRKARLTVGGKEI